MTNIVKTI